MILNKLSFFSTCLARLVEVNILLPEQTWAEGAVPHLKEFPTLYLLHGYGDNHTSWQRWTNIEHYAEQHKMIVIMPAGERSWYADHVDGSKYFTFVTEELPAVCRKMFAGVSTKRETTFVAGLSMGGYGALKIALTYPERYAGVASFSGAVDVTELASILPLNPTYWNNVFGDAEHLEGTKNDIFFLAAESQKQGKPLPRVYLWCGTEDRLIGSHQKLTQHLTDLNYPLHSTQSAGNHSWPYWDREVKNAIPYLLEK